MEKNEIESALREYVRENLSPSMKDIQFVAKIYKSFTDVLGSNNCLQIGSFPRYTAVIPLHDLDVLYKLGQWNEANKNPKNILEELAVRFKTNYVNPTSYKMSMMVQTHSISFKYLNGEDEVFAVDIVPAMNRGKNEFGDNTYYVPEILKFRSQNKRQKFYEHVRSIGGRIDWIKTDPLGYISVASAINNGNDDFRKSVKFIKGWKNYCKELNENFKLKSFHLEQLATIEFQNNIGLTIFDAVYKVLSNLKQSILKAHIPDRADRSKYIDQYVEELSGDQIDLIGRAIDAVVANLDHFEGNIERVIKSGYQNNHEHEKSAKEQALRNISKSILGGAAYSDRSGAISRDQSGVKHKAHTNYGGG